MCFSRVRLTICSNSSLLGMLDRKYYQLNVETKFEDEINVEISVIRAYLGIKDM